MDGVKWLDSWVEVLTGGVFFTPTMQRKCVRPRAGQHCMDGVKWLDSWVAVSTRGHILRSTYAVKMRQTEGIWHSITAV